MQSYFHDVCETLFFFMKHHFHCCLQKVTNSVLRCMSTIVYMLTNIVNRHVMQIAVDGALTYLVRRFCDVECKLMLTCGVDVSRIHYSAHQVQKRIREFIFKERKNKKLIKKISLFSSYHFFFKLSVINCRKRLISHRKGYIHFCCRMTPNPKK